MADDADPKAEKALALREVQFEYSREFPRILEHLNAALVVSTYQAGKLAVIGTRGGRKTTKGTILERVFWEGIEVDRFGAKRCGWP